MVIYILTLISRFNNVVLQLKENKLKGERGRNMSKRKQKESQEVKYTPIFPIYLDTMRIKDTLAIVNNGITNIYTVTKDTTNESGSGIGIKGSGDLYKVSLGGTFNKKSRNY